MKRCLFIFILLLSSSLFAYPQHTPKLCKPLHALYQVEETKQIILKAESEGPIRVRLVPLGPKGSNAMWIPSKRSIYLNSSIPRSEGVAIRSILFELHNSLSNSQFDYYNGLVQAGKISKAAYVETIERIEHQNALQTAALLERGIRNNQFPLTARWNVLHNFETHFQLQKKAGHSQFIAYNYDTMNTYRHVPYQKAEARRA